MNPQEMIKELIQKTGNEAESIIANGLNLQKKGNNYKCPSTHNHRNNDKNPSMGWDRNRYFFNCFGCGENIDIYTYYKNYCNYSFNDIMIDNGIKTLEEKRMSFMQEVKSKWNTVNKEHAEYIQSRGISIATIKKFKLGSFDDGIALPYTKNGLITGVKIRTLNSKEQGNRLKSITGSKFFFFNYDNIDLNKPVIICEGEFDCMTLVELGYNAVSVGCGANSLSALFEQSEDFFKKVNEFIVLGDNDENGKNMELKFIEKLGAKVATVEISKYLGTKDVNDLYLNYGADAVKNLIISGKRKFDGEWDIDEDPYTGLDDLGIKYIPSGIPSIDYAINDIQTKSVTLITGRSNSGKSTYVNQILANAISNNFKVYFALGEGNKDKVINKWYTSLVGHNKEFYSDKKINKRDFKEPNENVLKAIQKWHKGKLKLFIKSLSEYKNTSQLFELLEYKLKTEQYDMILLDNLMSLLTVESASEKNESQAKFIEMCHSLAIAYNVAVVIVLHPNKSYRKGQSMDFEQISGNGDISNKADIILNVIRLEPSHEDYTAETNAKIEVIKNRDLSDLPSIDCLYDLSTNTYGETGKDLTIVSTWKNYLNQKDKEIMLMKGVKEFEQITSQEDISPFL